MYYHSRPHYTDEETETDAQGGKETYQGHIVNLFSRGLEMQDIGDPALNEPLLLGSCLLHHTSLSRSRACLADPMIFL